MLNTTIGNLTRFENLRKYAARDLEVRCSWTPVTHLLSVDAASTLRGVPWALAVRLWVLRQMWPALLTLAQQDVVMLHLFEAEIACVARSYFSRRPALVSSTDEAPIVDPDSYPVYPNQMSKPPWRRSFRLWLDRWRASRIDAFIPFTAWGAGLLADSCRSPASRFFRSTWASTSRCGRRAALGARRQTGYRACFSWARISIAREETCSFGCSSSTSPIRQSFTSFRRKPPKIFLAAFTSTGTCNRTTPA